MPEPQKTSQPPPGRIGLDVFPPTPATAQRESVLVLDAIEQLIGAAHLHYRRIQGAARQINDLQKSAAPDAAKKWESQVSIVADIGALIGTVQRLRGLVKRLPGASTRLTKRSFEAGARAVQEPRHHLEHLASAIKDISETGQGAFGAVSWWYLAGEKYVECRTFIPGTIAVGKEQAATQVPDPEQITEEIGHVWASIAGSHFNVSAVYRSVTELEGRLRKWGAKQAEEAWP